MNVWLSWKGGGNDNGVTSIGVSKEIRDRFTRANKEKNASLFLASLLDLWDRREKIIQLGLRENREYQKANQTG